MSVIFLLLTVSTLVAGLFLAGFIWAVRAGQYDDDRSPAVRMLMEDAPRPVPGEKGGNGRQGHGREQRDNAQAHSTAP
jgi:cbb3-type cytochrome oxidase maturation protein